MPVLFRPCRVLVAVILFWSALCFAGTNPVWCSAAIVINLPSRTLELYTDGVFVKEYPVAIGKPSTPSPLGTFSIINKEYDPAWYPPRGGYVVPSGPDNPLGYRWMGFLPMYGIHGTNAPWAIGTAVSNGCIRMHEADVEEIFESVPYGTSVQLTYETARVRLRDNQVSVGIYPDVYGYGSATVSEVRSKLHHLGVGWILTDEAISRLIQEEAEQQVVVGRFYQFKINGKTVSSRAILENGVLYVPVWPVAAYLAKDITWDEAAQTLQVGRYIVPGVVKDHTLLTAADNLSLLFGGRVDLSEESRTAEVSLYTVYFNGRKLEIDTRQAGLIPALPVLPLAKAAGYKAHWDEAAQALSVEGRPVPVSVIGNEPYLPLTKVYEYLKAYVYLNEAAYSIDLTHPFSPVKGSD